MCFAIVVSETQTSSLFALGSFLNVEAIKYFAEENHPATQQNSQTVLQNWAI
jgi:hypothetical protein